MRVTTAPYCCPSATLLTVYSFHEQPVIRWRAGSACRSCRLAGWQFVPPYRGPPVNCMVDASIVESSSSVADLGGAGVRPRTPLASFRKIQGLPISKIVRTADSRQIIIITNFTLQLAPTKFFKGRRERGHEGAWGTLKAPAAAPPLQKSWIRHWSSCPPVCTV